MMKVDPELAEWDYGHYEGLTTNEINAGRQQWNLFESGAPGGETPEDVATRADAVIRRLRDRGGRTALFSSGHLLRVLAVRWIGLPPVAGGLFVLNTASVSVLGYDHHLTEPVIRQWNEI